MARLDANPRSAAGHTFDLSCNPSQVSCSIDTGLEEVRVESNRTVTGVDIGDWGTEESQRLLWELDTTGAPLAFSPMNPSAGQLPWRSVAGQSPQSTNQLSELGAHLPLPADWRELRPSFLRDEYYGAYFANEAVGSPLELDGNGMWLTLRYDFRPQCPGPDWAQASARILVPMQSGDAFFYLEDPQAGVSAQPFTGYSLVGGTLVSGRCVELLFSSPTKAGLEANLTTIVGVLEQATFIKPF